MTANRPPAGFDSAEAFLDAFASSVGGLAAYVDRTETMRFVTRGFADWFGKTREEIVGRTLESFTGRRLTQNSRPG
jgi:PAS domain-containing protein